MKFHISHKAKNLLAKLRNLILTNLAFGNGTILHGIKIIVMMGMNTHVLVQCKLGISNANDLTLGSYYKYHQV
jgi:hypothetical protein